MVKFSATRMALVLCAVALCARSLFAQAQIRVAPGYEDSVRILILWNNPTGSCGWMPNVGPQTRDFTIKSLSGGNIGDPTTNPNIKILPTETTTWANVVALWPGKLPHVIVHVNAGWETSNGPNDGAALMTIYDSATTKYIGIVEIGDDAAYLGIKVFGFTNTSNVPPPIGDGTQYTNPRDTMFVGFYPNRDTLVDSTNFPYLKGIIHNAVVILGKPRADFKTYVNGRTTNPDTLRCQADADQYNILPAFQNRLTFLGYQNASRSGVLQVVPPNYSELDVVVAFQDTIHVGAGIAIRRAVALSIEPQFLKNTQSMYQLTYDAIMFASLAWQLRPVNKMTLQVPDSCIQAGDTTTIKATLYRDNVPDTTPIKDSVNWKLDPATSKPGDFISKTMGQSIKVSGTIAYRTIDVIAYFVDQQTKNSLADTAHICVLPGNAYRIYIVGVGDTARTVNNQNTPHPLDRVTMDSATNNDTVYAVTYDQFNNWVGKANNAVWGSQDSSVVIANGVQNKSFIGNIDRKTKNPDSTSVTASQTGLIPGSVTVILQIGTIIAIRLVDNSGNPVTSVTINTDQTAFLQIQVQWSNAPGVWVNGSGSWTLNPNTIQWVNNPPAGNQVGNWTLDPKTPGQTNLTVVAGNKSLTIPITITVADPNKIVLAILTPPDSRIAGDTILIEQRIYNTDGLVPNYPDNWCKGDAAYSDTLTTNKLPTWVPTVTIPAASAWTSVTFGSTGKPCFQNGIDTVKAVLYDAPYNQDTLHQISVFLTTGSLTLKGTTSPFILLPGPLDSISIEDANFIAIPGPVTLNYPGDMRFFYSNGYDRYQNLIGHINTSWTPTDNLHAIPPPADNIFRIYYEAVDANEQGFILTQTPSLARSGVVLFDSVEVRNIGSQAVLDSAVTKDLNGNGYLDHIFVYFNKPVSLDASYAVSNITLRYTTTVFAIDSVRVADAGNKVFIIYLRDSVNAQNGVNTAKAPPPQTGWRPLLTMNNLVGAAPIVNVKCRDGAGPVIWRVVVNRNKVSDRKQDLVTITFSEPIKSGITGDAFQPTTAPGSVFNVWESAGGTFTKLDNILAGIGSFNQIPDPLTLTFYMTNAKELFSYDYFNIKSDNVFSSISDNAFAGKSNIPLDINQKVLVEIQGAGGTLQVGPNPLIPTISNGGPDGSVNFKNEPRAVNWVRNNGGTIFRVLISPGQGTVTGYLKIYDVVGNLVNEGRQDKDMMKEIRDANPNDTSAVYNYDIYWNGTNSQGMKCAPGAYVGIVYLTTTKIGGSNTAKLVQKVGVARKTASAHH